MIKTFLINHICTFIMGKQKKSKTTISISSTFHAEIFVYHLCACTDDESYTWTQFQCITAGHEKPKDSSHPIENNDFFLLTKK